jgi:hypothetical protein
MSQASESKRHGIVWAGVVVGFLVMTIVIQGTLLVFALNDPSFAVEPDYENRAANWDAIQRAQAASDGLGWTVELETRATATPGEVEVWIHATDSAGQGVSAATATFEAFHNARASRITRGMLPETDGGVYGGTFLLRPSGIWEFRVEIARGEDRFLGTFRESVLSLPRAPGSP